MKITFLGTGTSMGIPMIGCRCATCRSTDERDKRLRASVWIQADDQNIIIDTGIDFRQQALKMSILSIDAVLFTHHHVDHVFGMDELRPVNFLQKKMVRIYASEITLSHLKRIYPYVFDGRTCPSDVPKIDYHVFDTRTFSVGALPVQPVPLFHGELPVTGFRIGPFAYCTDVSRIPDESYGLLQNLDVLVLGALRNRPHPTHFTLQKAMEEACRIGARKTYLVHMSHELSHREMLKRLPDHIQPAYDGLQLELQYDSLSISGN
jgi:phosphoribosyl 1,2-cyclic phosphate phosphodiesterase